jgi:hypothetical protein
MTGFPHLLELLLPNPSKLLIIGDFNIHVDSKLDSAVQTFVSLLESYDLLQQVSGPTHNSGHTLDLVVSCSADK